MSKYVYEQFVTPDKLKEITTDASGVRKGFFGAAKLQSLTPEKRLNALYSAIRDVEGNEEHPIVKALKNYILGQEPSAKEQVEDALKQGKEAYEASKEPAKINIEKGISKVQPVELNSDLSKLESAVIDGSLKPSEKGLVYQRVELSHQFEGDLLTAYIKG